MLKRCISLVILITFVITSIIPPSYAQAIFALPAVGEMVNLTPIFNPPIVAGLSIDPKNPLAFNFIVDTGDDKLQGEALREESKNLIGYFMASLTTPEKDMWVNLSPYEKNRVIANGLGDTVMGRDMLAQDYILKQLSASLMYPEGELGKKFIKTLHEKTGLANIPSDIFNKIWIIPDKASIYVQGNSVFVADSHLKVMMEEDYLATREALSVKREASASASRFTNDASPLAQSIIKELLLPAIEKEVNEGKNFATLRQIYHSMILATWYKKNLKESILGKVYVDQNKTQGVDVEDKDVKNKIYNQYVEAFKKGVYDYIKEDYDPTKQEIVPKKYFSGGFDMAQLAPDQVMGVAPRSWIAGRAADAAMAGVQVKLNFSGVKSDNPPSTVKKTADIISQGIQAQLDPRDAAMFTELDQTEIGRMFVELAESEKVSIRKSGDFYIATNNIDVVTKNSKDKQVEIKYCPNKRVLEITAGDITLKWSDGRLYIDGRFHYSGPELLGEFSLNTVKNITLEKYRPVLVVVDDSVANSIEVKNFRLSMSLGIVHSRSRIDSTLERIHIISQSDQVDAAMVANSVLKVIYGVDVLRSEKVGSNSVKYFGVNNSVLGFSDDRNGKTSFFGHNKNLLAYGYMRRNGEIRVYDASGVRISEKQTDAAMLGIIAESLTFNELRTQLFDLIEIYKRQNSETASTIRSQVRHEILGTYHFQQFPGSELRVVRSNEPIVDDILRSIDKQGLDKNGTFDVTYRNFTFKVKQHRDLDFSQPEDLTHEAFITNPDWSKVDEALRRFDDQERKRIRGRIQNFVNRCFEDELYWPQIKLILTDVFPALLNIASEDQFTTYLKPAFLFLSHHRYLFFSYYSTREDVPRRFTPSNIVIMKEQNWARIFHKINEITSAGRRFDITRHFTFEAEGDSAMLTDERIMDEVAIILETILAGEIEGIRVPLNGPATANTINKEKNLRKDYKLDDIDILKLLPRQIYIWLMSNNLISTLKENDILGSLKNDAKGWTTVGNVLISIRKYLPQGLEGNGQEFEAQAFSRKLKRKSVVDLVNGNALVHFIDDAVQYFKISGQGRIVLHIANSTVFYKTDFVSLTQVSQIIIKRLKAIDPSGKFDIVVNAKGENLLEVKVNKSSNVDAAMMADVFSYERIEAMLDGEVKDAMQAARELHSTLIPFELDGKVLRTFDLHSAIQPELMISIILRSLQKDKNYHFQREGAKLSFQTADAAMLGKYVTADNLLAALKAAIIRARKYAQNYTPGVSIPIRILFNGKTLIFADPRNLTDEEIFSRAMDSLNFQLGQSSQGLKAGDLVYKLKFRESEAVLVPELSQDSNIIEITGKAVRIENRGYSSETVDSLLKAIAQARITAEHRTIKFMRPKMNLVNFPISPSVDKYIDDRQIANEVLELLSEGRIVPADNLRFVAKESSILLDPGSLNDRAMLVFTPIDITSENLERIQPNDRIRVTYTPMNILEEIFAPVVIEGSKQDVIVTFDHNKIKPEDVLIRNQDDSTVYVLTGSGHTINTMYDHDFGGKLKIEILTERRLVKTTRTGSVKEKTDLPIAFLVDSSRYIRTLIRDKVLDGERYVELDGAHGQKVLIWAADIATNLKGNKNAIDTATALFLAGKDFDVDVRFFGYRKPTYLLPGSFNKDLEITIISRDRAMMDSLPEDLRGQAADFLRKYIGKGVRISTQVGAALFPLLEKDLMRYAVYHGREGVNSTNPLNPNALIFSWEGRRVEGLYATLLITKENFIPFLSVLYQKSPDVAVKLLTEVKQVQGVGSVDVPMAQDSTSTVPAISRASVKMIEFRNHVLTMQRLLTILGMGTAIYGYQAHRNEIFVMGLFAALAQGYLTNKHEDHLIQWEKDAGFNSDSALLSADQPKNGGIDLNANNLNMTETGQKLDIHFNNLLNITPNAVTGIEINIINITPILNFPAMIGLADEQGLEKVAKL